MTGPIAPHAIRHCFGRRCTHFAKKSWVYARADDACKFCCAAGLGLQPCQPRKHRILNRFWQSIGIGLQQFSDEQWIARGSLKNGFGVLGNAIGHGAHRLDAEAAQLNALHGVGTCDLAQKQTQISKTRHLVAAVTRHQQEPCGLQPPCKELQEIERCVIGPVNVLDHHQDWLGAGMNGGQNFRKQLCAIALLLDQSCQ
jgi:hypothetical protein